jgi:hypothetical protein
MMLFDHGMPRADGTMSKEQRPEADVNIEFQMNSAMAQASQALAWSFQQANEKYASDYPATVGSHMVEYRFGAVSGLVLRSACERTNAWRRSGMVGSAVAPTD